MMPGITDHDPGISDHDRPEYAFRGMKANALGRTALDGGEGGNLPLVDPVRSDPHR